MASETDFAFDELGNFMENNYETDNTNALGTSLMDNYVWQDDDISKSIEVLGTSLIDKLGRSLQEDWSKSHDASDTSVTKEHITFQEDNMTKKDNVDAFGSSITSTKPTNSNSCFLNIQMENPSFTERTKKIDEENIISGDNDSMCRLYVEKRSMEEQNRIYMKLKQPPNEKMTQISALHGRNIRNNSMRCY